MTEQTPDTDRREAYRRELRTASTEAIAEHYRRCRDEADRHAHAASIWRELQQEAGEVWADRVNLEADVSRALAGDS